MNAVIKINTVDLTEQIIHDLQEKYGTAELEIRVRSEHEKEVLSDSEFWRIIALLNWEKTGDDAAVIAPAVDELSKLPVVFIYQFQDKLAEKLYQLDTQMYAENCGVNRWQPDKYFSVDVFLYERCCVVANGKDFTKKSLQTLRKRRKILILNLCSISLQMLTKNKPTHQCNTHP